MRIGQSDLALHLPYPNWNEADERDLKASISADHRKLVVLDDDPTGIQTVHDVPVYTGWSLSEMEALLREPSKLCFVLTNTRALSRQAAAAAIRQIVGNICTAAAQTGSDFSLISRGDSTLRGHWPLENSVARAVMAERMGLRVDGEMIIPCFVEGGRITWNDVHWIASGADFIAAGETEFAADRTFAYHSSDLRQWVAEKTAGEVPAGDVLSISLPLLRTGGAKAVAELLVQATDYRRIVVNAVTYSDLQAFTLGLLQAEALGRRFLFQSAASFVKVRGGISDRSLLTRAELVSSSGQGGLVIVGSHVERTNRQLAAALRLAEVQPIELDAGLLVGPDCEDELGRSQSLLEQTLQQQRVALVYTSRTVLTATAGNSEANLQVSALVSKALVRLVQRLQVRPSFMISKGGITSSDIGTEGLSVRRALTAGQVRPGIPVWLTGEESKFPGLPLIIFPGNVGDDTTLADLISQLAP